MLEGSISHPIHIEVQVATNAAIIAVIEPGVNDSPGDAEQLASFLRPIEFACADATRPRPSGRTGVLVNLIPYNAGAAPALSHAEDAPRATLLRHCTFPRPFPRHAAALAR